VNKKSRKAFAAGRAEARSEYSLWYTMLPTEVKQVVATYQREQSQIRHANKVAEFDSKITFDFSRE
jgi:hypothetical protein